MVSTIEPLLVGINDAAQMLGLSRSKLYELIAEKRIPLVKIGRSSRVPLPGLKAFTASLNNIAA
jgi:excisionase family DNA binding protein